jgi:hypothetical protein
VQECEWASGLFNGLPDACWQMHSQQHTAAATLPRSLDTSHASKPCLTPTPIRTLHARSPPPKKNISHWQQWQRQERPPADHPMMRTWQMLDSSTAYCTLNTLLAPPPAAPPPAAPPCPPRLTMTTRVTWMMMSWRPLLQQDRQQRGPPPMQEGTQQRRRETRRRPSLCA